MKEYIVRGNAENKILPYVEVNANSVEEALNVGEKRLEEIFCSNNGNNVRVDLVFDKRNMQILYKSEKIIGQNEERRKEKFDLHSAIKDGCPIDESGVCTCGGG